MDSPQADTRKPVPFDTAKLDGLMEKAGIDVLLATSKHNVQYLLGGYRFFFFDYMDAIGVSRYLPILVYPKGKPENAAYVAYRLERNEYDLGKFWPGEVKMASTTSADAMKLAVEHIGKVGNGVRRVGIEAAFLPLDAANVLRQGLSNVDIVDSTFVLERLRVKKTPAELASLKEASERVVASMVATFAHCAPGMTKNELVQKLREEEVSRGLTFEYCLITSGSGLNRSPSDHRVQAGDILSIDSGGNYHGYIGDLCRMGILGAEPDQELKDLLGFVDEVQQAARKPIKAGNRGGDIYVEAEALLAKSPHKGYVDFLAHGMGLVSHEGPRLTAKGTVTYDDYDAHRPLEAGMVVSIETTMKHPTRGFIKLEDTVAVTETGWEGLGDTGRGWNKAGA